jgi:hypothetical protein
MDGGRLQNLIYGRGYAQAATKMGLSYSLYRPASAGIVVGGANLVGSVAAHFRIDDGLTQPAGFGQALWRGWFDGRLTLPGDYLVGPGGCFFVAAQQALLPPLCVKCNHTLTVTRPGDPVPYGALGYDGGAADLTLLAGWPASVLIGPKGEKNEVGLPGDVKQSWWAVLMPAYAGVRLAPSDLLTDESGQTYVVASVEITDLGLRLRAQMVNC